MQDDPSESQCSCARLPALPPPLIALCLSCPGRRFGSGARTQSSRLGPSCSSSSAACCRAQGLLSSGTSAFFGVRLGDEWRVMSGSAHLQISDPAPGPLRELNKLPGGHQLCVQLRPLPLPVPFASVGFANENAHLREEKKEEEDCFRPVSNREPFACEANVITTTLRKRDNGYW